MTMPLDFSDRVAIVTGAGNGLGRDYALALALRGAKVVVNDLGRDAHGLGDSVGSAQQVVDEIRAAGGQAVANGDSVATRAGGAAIVECALDSFGRVDILINNAGILRNRRFVDIDDADLDGVLDTHLRGAFYVTQPTFRAMQKQNYGRILFTSSASGLFGEHMQANYAAAKTGVVGLMHVVALEGERYGIRANALMPSAMTRMAMAMGEEFEKEVGFTDFSLLASAMAPEFVTPLAIYLVSESCRQTHAIYSATAGRYARVFIGMGHGWRASREKPSSPEEIAEHFDSIDSIEPFTQPGRLSEEFDILSAQIRSET